MDDDELIEIAQRFAAKHGLIVGERLGSGIHGRVCLLVRNGIPVSALKVFRADAFFRRERDAYIHLQQLGIRQIRGCAVPQLVASDDELLAVEMTVVSPPFVLDFASVRLEWPPEFSDEVLAERERNNEEQFVDDWPRAQIILAELEELGMHTFDPSPSNIRFR